MNHTALTDVSPRFVVPVNEGDSNNVNNGNANIISAGNVSNNNSNNSNNNHSNSHNNHNSNNNASGNETPFELWNQELLREKCNSIFSQPNSHALNDRQIQEALSPFFTGVDVTHLPMTNPPIFQSSIAHYDEPIRRRRISISNGQIGQLGEDVESVENLYESQVPPMPPTGYHPPSTQQAPQLSADLDNHEFPSVKQQKTSQPAGQNPASAIPMTRSSSSSNGGPEPGTPGWKRARMLERNRVAAYKCRQRKKVAQVQLQRDFDVLVDENRVMKKKLDYYEKLVTKFKTFFEGHLGRCASNEKESLQIIESMLRIDSGVSEVDDSGRVVKMEI